MVKRSILAYLKSILIYFGAFVVTGIILINVYVDIRRLDGLAALILGIFYYYSFRLIGSGIP